MVSWFERDPDRLQRELDALEAADLSYQVDDAQLAKGILSLSVTLTLEGRSFDVNATYPDSFPYFKPLITGPDLGFTHHFHPRTGEYCLLRSGHGAWVPSDTMAWLLTGQWGKFLELTGGMPVPQNLPRCLPTSLPPQSLLPTIESPLRCPRPSR